MAKKFFFNFQVKISEYNRITAMFLLRHSNANNNMLILIIGNIYSSCMLFHHFICIISIPQRLYEASRLDCLLSTCLHHHTLLTYPSALQGRGDGARFSRMPSLCLVPGLSLPKRGKPGGFGEIM